MSNQASTKHVADLGQENWTSLKARATAYSPEQAVVYDERRFRTADGQAIHELELAQLQRALRYVKEGGRILELGCGTGRFLEEARRAGFQVDGADASGAMLEELRKKLDGNASGVRLLLAEAAKVPLPDESYDLVYAIRLLNQTESPEYALRVVTEMIRLARRGGYVLIEFVNDFRPRWGAARTPTTRLKPRQVVAHVREYGAVPICLTGSFLLSMQAYHAAPRVLLRPLRALDRLSSWMFPRLCSRCYVLAQRDSPSSSEVGT